MKGKIDFKFKVFSIVTLMLVFAFSLTLTMFKNSNKQDAVSAMSKFSAETANGVYEEFSGRLEGNVLFSAEKVLIDDSIANADTDDDDYELTGFPNVKTFYQATQGNSYGEARHFLNYYQSGDKYVVGHGEFVMFDNVSDNGGYYYSHKDSGLTEAIIVSLGQYVYTPKNATSIYDKVETATHGNSPDPIHAGITALKVKATHNGKEITLGGNRNISADDGPFYDFMYVIPQIVDDPSTTDVNESTEGYYEFTFEYMKDGVARKANFNFYLLFKTSYSGTIDYTAGNTYNIEPTLGWNQTNKSNFEKTDKEGAYIRYFSGKDGLTDSAISYPSITYDYTRFSFKYSTVSKNRTSTYIYNYRKDDGGDKIVYNKTTSLGTEEFTIPLIKRYDNQGKVVSNLVTVLLTEPGSYEFEFEYVYGGFNSANAPAMNLEGIRTNLYIHGFDLLYSKHNYQSAQMKQYVISYNEDDCVDLIVPEGFNAADLDEAGRDGKILSNYANKEIGFVYTLEEDSSERVGDILINTSDTHNTLLNAVLNKTTNNGGGDKDYKFLIDTLTVADGSYESTVSSKESGLSNILNAINYERTNQGYVSFRMNEAFDNESSDVDSFYYFSENRLACANINEASERLVYTNETSFVRNGFYLVFMKVYPKGLRDEPPSKIYHYYQIFAFEYTTSTINLDARESTGKANRNEERIVPSFGFTNKDVSILWAPPGVFDRQITAKYYISTNKDATIEQMLSGTANTLVENNLLTNTNTYFTKFLIEVSSEGKSATHYVFTIDKEKISQVGAYVISQLSIPNSNNKYYRFAEDDYGDFINISSGITDTFATINWADKKSGAQVYAEWSYTEFIDNAAGPTETFEDSNQKSYIATSYKLGSKMEGIDIYKSENTNDVDANNVLKGQGIYEFNLVDQAGNTCKYMLIIDKTENYFKLSAAGISQYYASGSSTMFGESVNFTIGDYKTISLIDDGNVDKSDSLETFLQSADYYTAGDSNKTSLLGLIKDIGENPVLAVKNTRIYYTDVNGGRIEADTSLPDEDFGVVSGKIALDRTKPNKTVIMYVESENSKYTPNYRYKNSRSKISVEINTDNAKGRVYFSSSPITDVPDNNKAVSDKDGVYDLVYDTEVTSAQATSAKYVGFAWNMGTGGRYSVAKVTYKYYKLNLTPDNTNRTIEGSFGEDNFFYQQVGTVKTAYNSGFVSENGARQVGTDRGFIAFGGELGTDAGLYVVTREYVADLAAGDNDTKVLSYYFIVDRNGIIEVDAGIGASIELVFSAGGAYNDFNKYGLKSNTIEDEGKNVPYYTYFTTTKVPATLRIPDAKYIAVENETTYTSNGYHAGKLNARIYFIDNSYQLGDYTSGVPAEMIYDGEFSGTDNDGFYTMDIHEYLQNNNNNVFNKNKFTKEENGGKWLYLPGIYVVVLQDNVIKTKSATGNEYNIRTFAFEIAKSKAPDVEFKTGWEYSVDTNDETKLQEAVVENVSENTFKITTSDEFVNFTLSQIDTNETRRLQIDSSYLIVKRNSATETNKVIINNPYSKVGVGGVDLNSNSSYVYKGATSTTIRLDTMLRNQDGSINTANLENDLEYIITFRYEMNVGNGSQAEKVAAANNWMYYLKYYNGAVEKPFYEATYRVIIDRSAPTTNLTNITQGNSDKGIARDELLADYEAKAGVTEMFTESYYSAGAKYYFTKQYNAYFATGTNHIQKADKLYILKVKADNTATTDQDESTFFDWNGLSQVWYKKIGTDPTKFVEDLELTKAIKDKEDSFTKETNIGDNSYSKLLGGEGYYEVVEIDKAGNQTQYIVYLLGEEEAISKLEVTQTSIKGYDETKDLLDSTSLEFYELNEAATLDKNGYFFKIELNNGEDVVKEILTDVTTDFSDISGTIANWFDPDNEHNVGYGRYYIVIKSRYSTSNQVSLGFYDRNNIPVYNTEKFIDVSNRRINIYGPNIQDSNSNWRYAQSLKIESGERLVVEYEGRVVDNRVVFTLKAGYNSTDEEFLNWSAGYNRTYKITGTDNFGESFSTTYNTSGNQAVEVEMEADGYAACYKDEDGVYYAFGSVKVMFDKTLFNIDGFAVSTDGGITYFNDKREDFKDEEVSDVDEVYYSFIILEKANETKTYNIRFIDKDNEILETITIVIDTHIANTTLRDAITAENRYFITKKNVKASDLNKPENMSQQIIQGNVNLVFDLQEKTYFTYTTILREIENDPEGTVVSDRINIKEGGKYQLIISVYSAHENVADRIYLGNFVYAMFIATQEMGLYEVAGFETNNSTFLIGEVRGLSYTYDDDDGDFENPFESVPEYELPLYISNDKDLGISYYQSLIKEKDSATHSVPNEYTFTIYKIEAANYTQYFGVLIIEKTMNIVKDVNVTKIEHKKAGTIETVNYYINTVEEKSTDVINSSGTMENEFEFKAQAVEVDNTNYLLTKNELVLEIYYNDNNLIGQPAKVIRFDRSLGINYKMLGSGDYSFVVKDLAGNIHYLNYDYYEEDESLEDGGWADFEANYGVKTYRAYIYREAIVYVNNALPIQNAYYNGVVEVGLYARARYVTGSISATGTVNGKPLSLGSSALYKFSAYGTYRIVFNARYDDGSQNGVQLSKIVTFTIINPREARRSLDITNLSSYDIVSITNAFGTDVYDVFKEIIANKEKSSMAITYEDLYNYSLNDNSKLEMYAGKQSYTITYQVQDLDYPTRRVSFSFMLNNETPKVECSLEPGKTTKKSFTFSFNPAIIYEQIGEAYVYINDQVVMYIGENAAAQTVNITRSFKENGAGDYYFKLASASGLVWASYKATIKEPLNAWAIVIIVVVVLVVGAVVTTIILLRHKMRIR